MRLGHHRHGTRAERRGRRPERGAVVVEMAIVGMFLAVILGATYDYGMAWRGSLAVTEGARAGARVGSSLGNDLAADRDLLLSVQAALSSSGLLDEVQRVVIYRSTTANGVVPATCRTTTSSVTGCNIVSGAQLVALRANSGYDANTGCLSSSISKGFCPSTRNDKQVSADYLGIYIRAEYRFMFPVMGRVQTIERNAVMKLEPQI